MRKREIVTCLVCGEEFEGKTYAARQFCGKICADKAKLGGPAWNKSFQVVLFCALCEKAFEVRRFRQDIAKYCSRVCASKAKIFVRGTDHPLFIPEAHINQLCATCGKSFRVKRAKVLMGEGRFCSRQCIGTYVTGLQRGRVSSIEKMVAEELTKRGEPFFAQMPLGPWTADFFLPRLNLVVECDGVYWHAIPKVMTRDRMKNGWMRRHKYSMLRLTEVEIRQDVSAAVSRLLKEVLA